MQFVATTNPEAYDYYLRGRRYMYSMSRSDYEHAIRMFEQAINIDGLYALAYAGMADAYSHLYRYAEATAENVEHAKRASEQALMLDPQSAEAHASRGLALVIGEHYDEARQEFDIAITLNPNLFEAYCYYGIACSSQGDFERAVQLYTRAAEINPADMQIPVFLAQAYSSLGRKQDEMRVRLGAWRRSTSTSASTRTTPRAMHERDNLILVGEKAKATELAERALRQAQNEPVVLYNVACFYVTKGDHERALELLEKAVAMGLATAPGSRPTATWNRCASIRA